MTDLENAAILDMETMMTTQAMVPATFFYNSDLNSENRQHMHFASHPGMQDMHMYPAVPTLASTPMYSRPSPSSQPLMLSKAFNPALPSTMTPMVSPRPHTQKPTIILETDISDAEGYPSTPPLSSSSSVISSPGSYDVLQTPLNPMFSGLDGVEGKEACVVEGLESFPNLDWTSCASPPMTPGESQVFFAFPFASFRFVFFSPPSPPPAPSICAP